MKKRARITAHDMDIIKIEGLNEFINFCYARNFFGRLKIAYRILFKRIGEIRTK